MKCRFCESELSVKFADLGMSPLANSYLREKDLNEKEDFFPLCAYVCENCLLVQLDKFENPKEIFSDYAYFSSYSKSWIKDNEDFASDLIKRFELNEKTQVIEIASNDGYLLENFQKEKIPVLGIDPAVNVAKVAQDKGIRTITKFFGTNTASELVNEKIQADMLIAVNVLPHTPELNDFVKGLKTLLKQDGVIAIQFSAYMLPLIQNVEFDMIYHEHFSYFSFYSIKKIFEKFNLKIFDVQEIDVHGGSLRIFAQHDSNNIPESENVKKQLEKEKENGIFEILTYRNYHEKVKQVKINLWDFFMKSRKDNKKIVGYGAPAKGNTLLNYCGIGREFLDFTVDISPHKQGLSLPGTHIPIFHPDKIKDEKPDYVLLLAWNLKDEIISQNKEIYEWGGKFVTPIPEVKIH